MLNTGYVSCAMLRMASWKQMTEFLLSMSSRGEDLHLRIFEVTL